MQVLFTQNQPYNNNIHFGAWLRSVGLNKKTLPKDKHDTDWSVYKKKILYCNDTYWFRWDLPTKVDDIVDMYKDIDKVNTYSYGCSNGSEPCSVWMYLVTKYGEKTASKFGVTKAKDIDPCAINNAKSGDIPIASCELRDILKHTDGHINKFFYAKEAGINDGILDTFDVPRENLKPFNYTTFISPNHKNYGCFLKQKPELKQNIEYSVADITKDWKNIEPENSVVFAQTFWPYLTRAQITELLSNLGQHLKKGCSLILSYFDLHPGDFRESDYSTFMNKTLELNGFSQHKSKSQYIFVRK